MGKYKLKFYKNLHPAFNIKNFLTKIFKKLKGIEFTIEFTENMKYIFTGNSVENQSDINKLYGLKNNFLKKGNAVMLGYSYDPVTDSFLIYVYSHNVEKRKLCYKLVDILKAGDSCTCKFYDYTSFVRIAYNSSKKEILSFSIQKDKKKHGKIKSSKTLIQSIGRILRNDKLEDLTQIPLVVDISDMFSI